MKERLQWFLCLVVGLFTYSITWALVALVILIYAFPAKAQGMARDVMLCDTEAQIEQVYTMYAEGVPLSEAQRAMNKEKNVCGVVTVISIVTEQIKPFHVKDKKFIIIKVVVLGIFDGTEMQPVGELEQYAMMQAKPEEDS